MARAEEVRITMWGLITLLVVVWLAMMLLNMSSGIVHLILLVAVVLFVVNLLTGRRAAV
jgi:hypothetical protein